MTTSINTNVSAYFAQNNLRSASAQAQSSIARLSSGNRIIRASDDVAALSIGTVLRTDVSTLRTALSNTSQAGSLIQVADGALQRLGEILQRQKALATQGNADTLSNTERGYLNQEFQALVSEYDRIATETNFNGIKILNGNLTGTAVAAGAATAGTVATTNITITPANTTTIAAISVNSLGTVATTGGQALDGLFTAANIASATVVATPSAALVGDFTANRYINSLTGVNINDLGKVEAINDFLSGLSAATVTFTGDVADDGTGTVSIVSGGVTFTSGTRDFTGNPGPAILTDATSGAEIRVDLNALTGTVTNTATLEAADTVIQAELRASAYTTSAVAGDFTLVSGDANVTAATVGALGTGTTATARLASITNFLDNIATAVVTGTVTGGDDGTITVDIVSGTETYTGTINFANAQGAQTFTNTATGATITIDIADQGITTDAAADTFAEGGFQTAVRLITASVVPNASDFTVTPVVNSLAVTSFGTNTTTGTANVQAFIAGFSNASAFFTGDGNDGSGVLTVQAGGITFVSADTAFTGNPASVVLTSTTGNGETITLDLNNLNLVSDDDAGLVDANVRVEDALKGLRVEDASNDGRGTLAITIGGATFTSPLNSVFGNNPTAILFTSGSTNAEILSIDLAALVINNDAGLTSAASAIQTAVRGLSYANDFLFAPTAGTTGSASFQVGTSSSDTIAISINDVRTTAVYLATAGDVSTATTLSVGTKSDAIIASAVLDNAIEALTSVRAQVGAVQSRFNFASATLETSIQNLDAARAGFLDADISNESTAFASQQVLIQASISVLAQANQLPQNLLKLIG
jgi:flagellin